MTFLFTRDEGRAQRAIDGGEDIWWWSRFSGWIIFNSRGQA